MRFRVNLIPCWPSPLRSHHCPFHLDFRSRFADWWRLFRLRIKVARFSEIKSGRPLLIPNHLVARNGLSALSPVNVAITTRMITRVGVDGMTRHESKSHPQDKRTSAASIFEMSPIELVFVPGCRRWWRGHFLPLIPPRVCRALV